MPNLVQKLKEFLGLSYKAKPKAIRNDDIFESEPIRFHTEPLRFEDIENKDNEKRKRNKNKEEVRMFEIDEEMKRSYEEVSEAEIIKEKRPGEYLVEIPQADGSALYKGIRLDLTAIYEIDDEYGYLKYYRLASQSDAYITDLSTVNFQTSGTEDVHNARIRRVLAEPRYNRTKLMAVNLIEVEATGIPIGLDTVKVPILEFMHKYKKFF